MISRRCKLESIVRIPCCGGGDEDGVGVLRLRRAFASRMACFAQDDKFGGQFDFALLVCGKIEVHQISAEAARLPSAEGDACDHPDGAGDFGWIA